jgi:CRP-like cAMP-binding protein
MPRIPRATTKQYPCESCPLRPLPPFRAFETDEVEFISSFKKGELSVDKGAAVMVEGSHSAHLFTVLSGWGFRYKVLPDGRRQILNFVISGDFVGLQAGLALEMQHVADTLGLSIVHTNKTLRKLSAKGLIVWGDGGCEVLDDDGLLAVAGWEGLSDNRRPLL